MLERIADVAVAVDWNAGDGEVVTAAIVFPRIFFSLSASPRLRMVTGGMLFAGSVGVPPALNAGLTAG
jgi:hypothetical protein